MEGEQKPNFGRGPMEDRTVAGELHCTALHCTALHYSLHCTALLTARLVHYSWVFCTVECTAYTTLPFKVLTRQTGSEVCGCHIRQGSKHSIWRAQPVETIRAHFVVSCVKAFQAYLASETDHIKGNIPQSAGLGPLSPLFARGQRKPLKEYLPPV
jgi:hypothetical protein